MLTKCVRTHTHTHAQDEMEESDDDLPGDPPDQHNAGPSVLQQVPWPYFTFWGPWVESVQKVLLKDYKIELTGVRKAFKYEIKRIAMKNSHDVEWGEEEAEEFKKLHKEYFDGLDDSHSDVPQNKLVAATDDAMHRTKEFFEGKWKSYNGRHKKFVVDYLAWCISCNYKPPFLRSSLCFQYLDKVFHKPMKKRKAGRGQSDGCTKIMLTQAKQALNIAHKMEATEIRNFVHAEDVRHQLESSNDMNYLQVSMERIGQSFVMEGRPCQGEKFVKLDQKYEKIETKRKVALPFLCMFSSQLCMHAFLFVGVL